MDLSPIYLKIIKFIRKNITRITIYGVDVPKLNRDKEMANNIIKKLRKDDIDDRKITELYETKYHHEKYRCGYYLKKKYGKGYCIILSTGYKGEIRYDSICDNKYCDNRIYPKEPIYKNFMIDIYKKYVRDNKFNDKIAVFTAAYFDKGELMMVNTKMWNYIIFFNNVNKLELIGRDIDIK